MIYNNYIDIIKTILHPTLEGEVHIMDKKTKLNWIYELRIAKDITIKELSITSGVSEGEISDLENGIKQPTHLTMLKICKGFDMKFEEIFETDYKNVKLM
jgi:DNA-binding XRE family transcriptional regulator